MQGLLITAFIVVPCKPILRYIYAANHPIKIADDDVLLGR